jgi:hypothetical protein
VAQVAQVAQNRLRPRMKMMCLFKKLTFSN